MSLVERIKIWVLKVLRIRKLTVPDRHVIELTAEEAAKLGIGIPGIYGEHPPMENGARFKPPK